MLRDVRHAAEGPPKGGIENSTLPLRSAGGLDFVENILPSGPRRRFDSLEVLAAGIESQIVLCLLRADIGEPDTRLDLLSDDGRLRRHKTDLVPTDAVSMLKRMVLPRLVAPEGP